MPLLAFAGLVLALFACVVAFYAAVFLFFLGNAVGVALAFGLACTVLSGQGRWQPVLMSPARVTAGAAGLPPRRGNNPYPRDWAWPAYAATQWRFDGLAIWQAWRFVIRAGYSRVRVTLASIAHLYARRIVAVVLYTGWTGVVTGIGIGGILVVVVCGIAMAITAIGWGLVAGTLRGYDRTVRRLRKADAACPHCYYKQRVPDYPCSHCHTVHRDIRPGLLGAVWRRCGCDARLPTTVLRAARTLTAQCERCGRPLRVGAGAVTSIRLPVFGPVSAGKTRLVYAALARLQKELPASGVQQEFVDESSRQIFDEGARVIIDGENTAKTPAGRLPPAVTARLTKGRREALVDLFDAAGEFFMHWDDNAELEFLDNAGGLVFVVDPFSIPWVQDQLGGEQDPRVREAQPAASPPEEVYQLTVGRLRDYQVDLRALAVVVVKADLLPEAQWVQPLLSGAVREWLTTAELDNLVLAAERDFATTRFFVASSVTGTRPGSTLSPAEPFRWLVDRGGFPLSPTEPETLIEESLES